MSFDYEELKAKNAAFRAGRPERIVFNHLGALIDKYLWINEDPPKDYRKSIRYECDADRNEIMYPQEFKKELDDLVHMLVCDKLDEQGLFTPHDDDHD